MGDMYEVLRKNLNFTYEAVPSIDGFYGSKVPFQILNIDTQ